MPPLRNLVIYLSLLVALVLMILPLPDWAQIYRPNWMALVLIYWSMALPKLEYGPTQTGRSLVCFF